MQDPNTKAKRSQVLYAIANLSERHGLPIPQGIDFPPHGGVSLRLDDGDRNGVHHWSFVLENGAVTEQVYDNPHSGPFLSVHSRSWDDSGPTWLDLRTVYVWANCEVPA